MDFWHSCCSTLLYKSNPRHICKMTFSIAGRAALMTGAANGISAAVSNQMLKGGLKSLIAMDLNPKIFDVVEELKSKYPDSKIIPVVGDVTDMKVR